MPNYLIPPAAHSPSFIGTVSSADSWGGNDFYTGTADVSVYELGWYRGAVSGAAPLFLKLRDTVTNTDVASVAAPDDALIGWHYVSLETPVPLVVGRVYRVALTFGSGFQVWRATSALPDAPFILETRRYGDTWPALAGTTSDQFGISVTDGPIEGPATPVETTTIITVQGAGGEPLAPWLSSDPDVQTHETDGLPWQTKVVADVIATGVNTLGIITPHIEDIVENIPQRSDSEWVKLTKLINLWLELSDLEYELLMDFLRRGPLQLTGDTPGGGSAFFGPTGRQVAETAERIEDALTGIRAPLEGFPTDFELVDAVDFVDCVSWNVAADVYVLHLTTPPAAMAFSPVCGVNMIGRAGWWAPLADTIPGGRGYIDFEFNVIAAPIGRLPGVLIQLKQAGEGHLEAWRRAIP